MKKCLVSVGSIANAVGPRRLLMMALVAALPTAAVADRSATKTAWTTPFQAGKPSLPHTAWRNLPTSRCDRTDPFAKCTFTAKVDYNSDGRTDMARMVEGGGIKAIVVDLAGRKAAPLVAATFKGKWNGSCYIEADQDDRTAILFTCPESSAALFKLRNGKPAAQWLAD